MHGVQARSVFQAALFIGITTFLFGCVLPEGDGVTARLSRVSAPSEALGPGTHSLRPSGSVPGTTWGYGEYIPAGYQDYDGWPIMISLHGIGECAGKVSLDIAVNRNGPITEMKRARMDFPMIILSPQNDAACNWDAAKLDAFVQFAINNYAVDSNRLYLAGLSLGGYGVAHYLNVHASKVAAVLAVCPGDEFTSAAATTIVQNGMPLWAAHAANDTVVTTPRAQNMIWKLWKLFGFTGTSADVLAGYPGTWSTAYLNTATDQPRWISGVAYQVGGVDITPPYLFSYHPNAGHAIWDEFYKERAVYQWLLKQSK
jgi:predicted peptidase